MKDAIKFTVVGAGSSYTPELIEELAIRRDQLPVREVMLYDIDESRLEIMTGFIKRFSAALGFDVKISMTTDLKRALDGAQFVDTQIRVGGNAARVRDEKIPLSMGLVGQETTGPGGMMKAFRTIPVMLNVAKVMKEVSPEGWLINYTNPTGLITEAITRYTDTKIAGFCSGGIFPKMWAKRAMGIDYSRVQYDYVGLNHLNFSTNITIDGRPVTEEEFCAIAKQNYEVDLELIKLLGALPSPYLQYYYHTGRKVEALRSASQTRGEYVLELEKEIYAAYADPTNEKKPAALEKRGGGGYSEVAIGFVNAVYNNIDTSMVVNVPNKGAVDFLPDDAVVEVGCLVNAHAVAPLHVAKVPVMARGLIAAVKNYEQLAVEAAVEGDYRKAMLALLAHPLVHDYDVINELLPRLLEANREYLPQFYPKG
ncbi:MAG TPA: 6-phospho-beta-glucosidase [Candidatus Mediterraneibacter stercoripullorum]|nr:6-phospho-beta-glucosidase [Candidatus Mediterraneibacter stercoripullorum]